MEVKNMAMVVQHNLAAMNANRTLGITAGQQAKSTEKLIRRLTIIDYLTVLHIIN